MARKKAEKKMESTRERRMLAVTLKGNEEWKLWLEEGAKYCRMTVSGLIDQATAEYLKNRGFKKEPPER